MNSSRHSDPPPADRTATAALRGTPTVALALGGGGARGLAHIAALEAFDELGIKPVAIAGTSIGAMYGAAYASGVSGAELRAHTLETLTLRFSMIRDLFSARAKSGLRNSLPGLRGMPRRALLDPEALLKIIMPAATVASFADLKIPLEVIASDYYAQEPIVLSDGSLRRAVAASMALPVVFRPVAYDDRVLIDGGMTNPLPFDVVAAKADIVVAIDVTGIPSAHPLKAAPTAIESLSASACLFERSIVREKLRISQPDILVHGGTGEFQVLDFLKCRDILAAAEPAKNALKAKLSRILSVETLNAVDTPRRP